MTTIRPLVIDDHAKTEAQRVMRHAEQHPYYLDKIDGDRDAAPGNDPNFVAMFGTYRVAFSYDYTGGRIYRHISISVPSRHYPNPAAVFALADLFGFTGWDQETIDRPPDGWLVHINEDEHCIAVAQQMKDYAYGGGNTN